MKNPDLPHDKYHRFHENLVKTHELYSKMYFVVKNMGITIIHGKTLNEKTVSLGEGII